MHGAKSLLIKMQGVPWNPVPGREDVGNPVEIMANGDVTNGDDNDEHPQELDDDEHDNDQSIFRGGPHSFHVSRKAVAKYGTTDGCAACAAIKKLGHLKRKSNHNHIGECKRKTIKLMQVDPQYRGSMEKHGLADASQSVEMVTEGRREEMVGHIRKAMHYVNSKVERGSNTLGHRLDKTTMEMLIANIQVAQVYNPPRVVPWCERQLGRYVRTSNHAKASPTRPPPPLPKHKVKFQTTPASSRSIPRMV